MFRLDPALLASSEPLMYLPLCAARLYSDRRFPWLVLIPRIDGAVELEDLTAAERSRLMDELILAGRAVLAAGAALGRPVEKLNVGQLGNVVPQLHLHVVGRRRDDPCWPGPVWGQGGGTRYDPAQLELARRAARATLAV
jgi:diadenosine tetraphosphate (Ap4A) HIT family hydrolase